MTGTDIDGVDAKARRQLRGAHPQSFAANLKSRRVFREFDITIQRQARRIVAHQRGKITIDDAGHAGPVTGGRDTCADSGCGRGTERE